MTLHWETAYKWASLSKWIAAWCLNRNSTVAGVIITVTFCIISVCALWIWGRVMATLMNQWTNEAAIVLVYWNTLRNIEDFCNISVKYSTVILSVTHPQQRIKVISWNSKSNTLHGIGIKKNLVKREKSLQAISNPILQIHSRKTKVWDEDSLRGQINWQGNLVAATCRAADYPWASIIFVYQKC